MVLEDVVGAAEAAEVAVAGQSAVVVGDGVVEVAAPGGLPAAGEPAGQVPGGDMFPEPWRGPVDGGRGGVRASAGGGVCGDGGAGAGRGGGGGLQCPGQDPVRRVRARLAPDRGHGGRVGQHVLGDGQGDPADQPYPGTRPVSASGPVPVPVLPPAPGPAAVLASLPGGWLWRVAAGAGDAGDGEGVPAGGGDDDPPSGARVAGGGRGEVAGLRGGDGPDPAQVARPGGDPGQHRPGQRDIEQAGDGPAAGHRGAGAGERGWDQPRAGPASPAPASRRRRGQRRCTRPAPGRRRGRGSVVVAGRVLVPGRRHVPGRSPSAGSAAGCVSRGQRRDHHQGRPARDRHVAMLSGSPGQRRGRHGPRRDRPVVPPRRAVWGCAVGGRDEGEGAEQQADIHLGGQQVDAAAGAGCLQRAGHRLDPGHRRGGMHGRQPLPGQRRGGVLIRVQHHLRAPLRVLAPFLRARRVRRDHRAAQRRAQHPGRLPPGRGQHPRLDRPRRLVTERAGGLRDEAGAGQVNDPGGQRRAGRGQPPAQLHGQVRPRRRAVRRHGQLQRHLRRRRPRHHRRTAISASGGVLVAGRGAGRDLRDRGQLPGLRPRRHPPPRPRDRGQVTITQARRRRGGQPRGQVRARRQPLSDPPRHRRQRHPPPIGAAFRRSAGIQLREIIQDRLLRRLLLRRARNRGTSRSRGTGRRRGRVLRARGRSRSGLAGGRRSRGRRAARRLARGRPGSGRRCSGRRGSGRRSGIRRPGGLRARGRSIRVRRTGTGDRSDQRTEIHLIRPRQAVRGTRAPSITWICRHRVTSSAEHLNRAPPGQSVFDQTNEQY